ncbi:MAG TPA: heavy metal translocating P-type ATPase metal-binding domain-containing protein [Mucilaginibacter sp.]|nr:heavy metal translocating P-type ATPase metal-binding domain-containing protein [Mucilaginibacter sp.]
MAETATILKTTCYHCGDECLTDDFITDERKFCCKGCMSVYQILAGSSLCNYYSYNDHPGATHKDHDKRFDYLSDPTIAGQLLDYTDERISLITFYVPQIHCSSCLWLLEQLNKLNPGIHYSRVDFLKKQLAVRFDHHQIGLQKVVELLYDIGYEPLISLQDVVKERSRSGNSKLIQKIAVAGFCFGNVMLLSFPEYFGLSVSEASFRRFFGYINLLFTIPSVFYCAWGYFDSAWKNLKNKVLHIDFPLALGIAVLFVRTAAEVLTHRGAGFADTLCGLVFFLLLGKFIQQKTYHHISFERDYRSFFPVAVQIIMDGAEKPIPLADLTTGHRMVIRHNEIIPADAVLLKGEALIDFSFVTGEAMPVDKSPGEIVYAGGRQMAGVIHLEVVKPVSQSYLTQLWNNDTFKSENESRIKTFSEKVTRYFTIILLIIAFGTFFFHLPDLNEAVAAFTSVLIVACPCALALSTPFTMSAVLGIFDRNHFYLKNTAVVEQLANIDAVVMDKTGTITTGTNKNIRLNGDLSAEQKKLIFSACVNSNHPLSRMICDYLNLTDRLPVAEYKETPGEGISACVAGHDVRIGSDKMIFGDLDGHNPGTRVHLMIDGHYLGNFSFGHHYREGLKEIISMPGYLFHLLSGDHNHEYTELANIFGSGCMHFNQSPQQKLDFIKKLQEEGNKVLMLGDGLNDSGALRQSDIGIAVTDNVNNFSPGSDAILDGRSFSKLPGFIRFSKDTVNIVRLSFLISLVYNIVGLSFAMTGRLSPLVAAVLMPVSTVTIITFTTVATHFTSRKRQLL